MLKEKLKNYNIILASGSPRRQQFFADLDIPFTVELKQVKEDYPSHLQGAEISDFLSELKANAFHKDLKPNDILITSDTIVWHKQKALGKPENISDAAGMLRSLSGDTHEVITSVMITTIHRQYTMNSSTSVTFKELSREEIDHYIRTCNPIDKAGAYGIQEWIGLIGITRIEGSYFNVVGLPTDLVYKALVEISSL